jgi:hypothetical protein
MTRRCEKECLYCDAMLSTRHEHDHYPLPVRHGGKETVCVCVNCHDLKDRVPLERWGDMDRTMAAFSGLWGKADPLERIVLSKLLVLFMEATQVLEQGETTEDVAAARSVSE